MGCTRKTLVISIVISLAFIVTAVSVVITLSGGEDVNLSGLKADGDHQQIRVGEKSFSIVTMNETIGAVSEDLGTAKMVALVMFVILAVWVCGHHGWLWRLHHGAWCPRAPVPDGRRVTPPECPEYPEPPGAGPQAPPTERVLSPVHVPSGGAREERDEAAAFLQEREFAGRPRLLGCPMGIGTDPQRIHQMQQSIYNIIDEEECQQDLRRYATGARPRAQGAGHNPERRSGVSLPTGHYEEDGEGPATKRQRVSRDYTVGDLYAAMSAPEVYVPMECPDA